MTRIIETVRHYGLADDPIIRQELMRLWTNLRVASYTNQRAMDRIKSGQLPGPEMSIAKLALTQNMWRMAAVRGRRPRAEDHRRPGRVGHLLVEPSSCSASPACASPAAATR